MIVIGIFFLIADFIEAEVFSFGVDCVEDGGGVDGGFGFEYWVDGYVCVEGYGCFVVGGGGCFVTFFFFF